MVTAVTVTVISKKNNHRDGLFGSFLYLCKLKDENYE